MIILTGPSVTVGGARVGGSALDTAGGSVVGSGLETQTCTTDLPPEVPVATYLVFLFVDRWKPYKTVGWGVRGRWHDAQWLG